MLRRGAGLWLAAIIPFLGVPWVHAGASASPADEGPTFERDVLPILRAHCLACHGESGASAALDLTSREAILEGGVSGPAVVANDPEKSLLLRRILGHDGLPQMPKGFAPLSEEKVAVIRDWIRWGAQATPAGELTKHWAYVPPTMPTLPPGEGAPIDRLVLAELARHGRTFSPEASRETLVRRLSLDLTGLPPKPEDVAAFLADERPDAYERLVDRLLASPHYGERMARPWLDLARFADSHGYEKDLKRQNWAWRDYVIRAYNEDKPFDQFTREQIAGDLLPEATREQIVATGFHRNTMLNQEGGTDPMEQRWLVLVDRVATTGTVWMGTSLGCAQCHDHKFDPVSQQEFFQVLAFWESADEPDIPLTEAETGPFLARLRERQAALTAQPDSEEKAAALKAIEEESKALAASTTMVFKESDRPAQTPIRFGGVYLSPGDVVKAGVVEQIVPAKGEMKTRLDLANWLVSRENPLTARVQVNRLWELLFGRGLVKSTGDLGTQSEPPSHPELLDYLAVRFMEGGWHVKPLIKEIVMSRTYRQSSVVREADLAWDPENIFLGRGSRFRLEAEAVRDNALAAAGLIDLTIGGPSVFPVQPNGIWDSPYSGESWTNDADSDRYRRGLYTFWKRTSPYPSFLAFDATSREVCAPGRVRTNTPLQALVLLNDPVYVEAAAALSKRMAEAGPEPGRRIEKGYQILLARRPSEREVGILSAFVASQMQLLKDDPKAEEKAWAMAASILLNLDETITRE